MAFATSSATTNKEDLRSGKSAFGACFPKKITKGISLKIHPHRAKKR
jgi:hypothetical protein